MMGFLFVSASFDRFRQAPTQTRQTQTSRIVYIEFASESQQVRFLKTSPLCFELRRFLQKSGFDLAVLKRKIAVGILTEEKSPLLVKHTEQKKQCFVEWKYEY